MMAGAAAPAKAANWYGAVDVNNPTNELLHYQFRWGTTGPWESFTLAPGEVRTHFWHYRFANEDRSPVPQVRFHYNPGEPAARFKVFDLEAWAVPERVVGVGKPYHFDYSADGRYIDLYAD
jgi:hypothetical protein